MTERNYSVEALVIASFPYKEADRIVTIFSRERGKLRVLAKGALKGKSSLRGFCQPPRHCRLALVQGRGSLDILTQGEMIEPFLGLHNALLPIAYSHYISELLNAGLPEGKVAEPVFYLALAAYSLLEFGNDPALALRFFQLRYLALLGFAPNLSLCVHCGRRTVGADFVLSPARGGLLCASCAMASESALPLLSPGTVKTMQILAEGDLRLLSNLRISAATHAQMGPAIENYLDYHLDYSAKARNFLQQLLAEQ